MRTRPTHIHGSVAGGRATMCVREGRHALAIRYSDKAGDQVADRIFPKLDVGDKEELAYIWDLLRLAEQAEESGHCLGSTLFFCIDPLMVVLQVVERSNPIWVEVISRPELSDHLWRTHGVESQFMTAMRATWAGINARMLCEHLYNP